MIEFLVTEGGDFLITEDGDFIIISDTPTPPGDGFWCAMTGMSGITGGGEIDGA